MFIFLLTGCSSDYELNINSDSIDDKVNFNMSKINSDNVFEIGDVLELNIDGESDSEIENNIINTIKNGNIYTNYDKYDSFFERVIDGDKVSLIHNYNNGSFETASMFNYCFGGTYYKETDDYYVINGNNSFKCIFKNKTKVSIKTDYKVIDSNADIVLGNEYIWYFTDKNSEDHDLYMQVSKKIKASSKFHWGLMNLVVIMVVWILYKFKVSRNRNVSNDV
jgi:hypothetical protein